MESLANATPAAANNNIKKNNNLPEGDNVNAKVNDNVNDKDSDQDNATDSTSPVAVSDDSFDSSAWCKRFYETGGFMQIYTLIGEIHMDLAVSSGVHKSCIVLLLNIVHFFMGNTGGGLTSPRKKVRVQPCDGEERDERKME